MARDDAAVLVRHAETEWSAAGRHTGRTDLPLVAEGRDAARTLGARLAALHAGVVLCSPARRARETCELSGFGEAAQIREDLWEWDYGEYEGLTSAQIRERAPGWRLWRDGCPGGESPAAVGARADRVVAELRERHARDRGPAIVFSHGHMLRVVGARWIDLAAGDGGRLYLGTASLSALGYEHGEPVLTLWNDTGARGD